MGRRRDQIFHGWRYGFPNNKWYQRLPAVERTGQVTAFITVVLPGIFGLAVYVYKVYADGGRSWESPAVQQTMQTVQTIAPVAPVPPVAAPHA